MEFYFVTCYWKCQVFVYLLLLSTNSKLFSSWKNQVEQKNVEINLLDGRTFASGENSPLKDTLVLKYCHSHMPRRVPV